MTLLYKGRHHPMYAQVALFDAEDPYSWPISATGEEDFVIGSKGVVVATVPVTSDSGVEILVYTGQVEIIDTLLTTTIISVGSEGLLVGTEAGTDVSGIPLPKGIYSVSIHVDGFRDNVTRVSFVLNDAALP